MKAEQNKPLIGLDNYTRSPAEEERLNMVFVETFNTASGKEVLKSLRASLGYKGINVHDVLLRDISLPERFKQSIENKLQEGKLDDYTFALENLIIRTNVFI